MNLIMSYKIEFSDIAHKNLRKMEVSARKQILIYLRDVLSKIENPRLIGKALTGKLKGLWRYHSGHFRIICRIEDDRLVVLVLKVAHRKDVYD